MTNANKVREELKQKLLDSCMCVDPMNSQNLDPKAVSDFILADRKRVVEPIHIVYDILKRHERDNVNSGIFWVEARKKWPLIVLIEESMNQTLSNAGVEV